MIVQSAPDAVADAAVESVASAPAPVVITTTRAALTTQTRRISQIPLTPPTMLSK